MTSATEHGTITDEALAAMRSRIGIPSETRRYGATRGLFTLINQDSAHIYATGSGDANPLYSDAAYARASHWGSVVAPPTILFNAGIVEGRPITAREREEGRGGGLPGVHGMFSGADWEWYQPLREGDEIYRVSYLSDAQEKSGVFAGRQVLSLTESLFRNQRGEVLAKEVEWSMRTERDGARERKKYDWEPHEYTSEELERIDEVYANERPRGAEPRYWEDVQVGDAPRQDRARARTARRTRSPGTSAGAASSRAAGRWTSTTASATRAPTPGTATASRTSRSACTGRASSRARSACRASTTTAHSASPGRAHWSPTGWATPASSSASGCRSAASNIEADVQWYRGEVIAKQIEDGEAQVICDIWAENQRGEVTAPGQAIVLLPSREHGEVNIPARGQPSYPSWDAETKVDAGGPGPAPPPLDHARLPAARRAALSGRPRPAGIDAGIPRGAARPTRRARVESAILYPSGLQRTSWCNGPARSMR